MTFSGESLITMYSDVMAFMLVFGLVILSRRVTESTIEGRLFLSMCISMMLDAIGNFFTYMFKYQNYVSYSSVSILGKTIMELAELFFIYQWVLYSDYKINGDEERLKTKFAIFFIPVIIFLFLLLLNPISGVMFSPTDRLGYTYTKLYYVMQFIKVLYLIHTIFYIVYYRKKYGRLLFFSANPLWIPLLIGVAVTLLSNYSAVALGAAIGINNLYFSMIASWQYEDSATGFYNNEYLQRLVEIAGVKKLKYHSAILFTIDEAEIAFAQILRKSLKHENNIIHYGKGKYLVFLTNDTQTYIDTLVNSVVAATDDYDLHNTILPMRLRVSSWIKGNNQEAIDFIRQVANK